MAFGQLARLVGAGAWVVVYSLFGGLVWMSIQFYKLAEDFYVAPQLAAEDFAAAQALGIRTVINNRPDDEEPGQLSNALASERAAAAGLEFAHVPVVSGGIFPDHIAAMQSAIEAHSGPYLAYCRSGTRSCFLWSFVAAKSLKPDDIVRAAADAGYDVRMVKPILQQVHTANRQS